MNNTQKTALSLVFGAALLGIATPAGAASKRCDVGRAWPRCTTGIVPANSNSHHVHVSVSSFLHWSVKDVDTGVTVGSGNSNLWGVERTITGLYGRYTATIVNGVTANVVGGGVTLHNT
jgi:hypothetical protein